MDNSLDIEKLTQVVVEDLCNAQAKFQIIAKDISETTSFHFVNRVIKTRSAIMSGMASTTKEDSYYDAALTLMANNTVDHLIHVLLCSVVPNGNIAKPIQLICSAMLNGIKGFEDAEPFDVVQAAALVVTWGCHGDMYDISKTDNNSLMIKSNYQLSEDTMVKLANYSFVPPMVTMPKEVKHNYEGAYLTFDQHVVLGNINNHNGKQSLDVINIQNTTPLALDEYMLEFIEESKKELDTMDKVFNFDVLCKASEQVYEYLIEEGNRFYLTNAFDFRGRLYMRGYHVSLQSYEYKKSLINLADPILIN